MSLLILFLLRNENIKKRKSVANYSSEIRSRDRKLKYLKGLTTKDAFVIPYCIKVIRSRIDTSMSGALEKKISLLTSSFSFGLKKVTKC